MFSIILKEYRSALNSSPIWIYLSKSDVLNRFRRSKIGILWPVVHQLAFSLGAGMIWAAVFNINPADFIPFLTLGFAIWGFISACMLEGCSTFVIAHGYLKQLPLSQSLFIFRTLFTQLIYLIIGLLTALMVQMFFHKLTVIGLVYSLPGLCILVIYAYGSIGSLAYLGLRYRDLPHGLSGLFSLLFVVTPVIYPSEMLRQKGYSFALYANPFASLIEIVRYPLINSTAADIEHYLIASIFAFVLCLIRFFLGSRWSRFVPYWS